MKIIDNFINSLQELYKKDYSSSFPEESLLFFLSYDIGVPGVSPDYNKLKSRLIELVEEEGFREEFLIKSLIKRTDEILSESLINHGSAILRNEKLLEQNADSDDTIKGLVKSTLERLKSPRYLFEVRDQIDSWNIIKSKYFSLANFDKWETEEQLKNLRS